MAGPAFQVIGALSGGASVTSRAPTLPTVDSLGHGIFLAQVCSKNNATHNCADSNWVKLNQTNSGASFTASLWVAPQTAAAPTFTWTGAANGHAIVTYYSDPANTITAADITNVTATAGTGTPHTSSALTTTRANALVVYSDANNVNGSMSTPTGWTEDFDSSHITSVTTTTWGSKTVATAGSSSGAISVSGSSGSWVQWQVEIIGTAASPGLQASKVATGAFLEPKDGLSSSKMAVGAWLDLNDFRAAKMEVGAWLEPTPPTPRRRQVFLP